MLIAIFSNSIFFASLSGMSSRHTTSPTDTACSSESPAFLSPQSNLLLYDQHSSEEELEVINGKLIGCFCDCISILLGFVGFSVLWTLKHY